MLEFHIIIVVYNQQINTSPVINTFIQNKKRIKGVFIVDNSIMSDIKDNNKQFCQTHDFCYVNMNGNYGLPKAYNSAIKLINKSENDWIILLDQDTTIPENFIDYYENAINNNSSKKIFCPIVKDSIGIMSPATIKGRKWIHSMPSDFNNTPEFYSYINSCMCVQSQVFEQIKYNEDLFLDCVDHDFVAEIKNQYGANSFYVIEELEIQQSFSGSTVNSLKSDLIRFKIYKKDLRVYSQKWFSSSKSVDKILFLRALKLCLCHKNLSFIKVLVSRNND